MNTHVAGGMTIGPASLDDLDAIEALEAAAFTGDRLSRRSLRAFIRAPRRPLIVARFGERVAGYALLSARKGGRTARIYSLAVDPAQGRRGVGRALLQACERYARAHGLEALRLEVRYDNPAAIALYEKMGFRPFGHYAGYYEDGAAALRFEKRAGAGRRRHGGVRRQLFAPARPTRLAPRPPPTHGGEVRPAHDLNRGRRDGRRLFARLGSRPAV